MTNRSMRVGFSEGRLWRILWISLRRCSAHGARLIIALLALLIVPCDALSQPSEGQPALLIDVKGAIGFVTVSQLTKGIEQARARAAPVLIVRLDTPGGLLTSTREMIQAILASPLPIVMYVAPSGARAASAGTYLMYASHIAAMAPGTHLGAATPIPLGTPGLPGSPPSKPSSEKDKDSDPSTASSRKSINDAVAYIRTLAQLRNRNADWAEKAVREAATLTASEARREDVIDVIATDINDLLTAIDGRTVPTTSGELKLATKGLSTVAVDLDWKMKLMSVITDPNIAFILLIIGIYGLMFEFWSPGAILPGVIGGISLIVALTALAVLPVSYAGLGLLLLGIGLMLFEKLNPGFGIAGLGGAAAFVIGALFLFDPSETDVSFGVSWQLVAAMTLLSVAFFVGIVGLALKTRQRPVQTGAEEMIGSSGEVVSWDGNEGRVRVQGEIWSARSLRSLSRGQSVRVSERTGLTLTVEEQT
jgi:membrane-bound serine protease (ClpP class)